MLLKKIFVASFAVLIGSLALEATPKNVFGSTLEKSTNDLSVPLGGNAYVVKGKKGASVDNQKGLVNWQEKDSIIAVYVRTSEEQKAVDFSIRARGNGLIKFNVNRDKKQTFVIKLDSDEFKEYPVGKIMFAKPGYQKIYIKGVEKSGGTFGEIEELFLKGVVGATNYVHDFDNYWGRRGPSVHLKYSLPKERNIEYFYGEITVPKGQDKPGTYYMVNGFLEGYCGIQVNSPKERRVLFSVWSPFETQDPKEIPEHLRVVTLRRGEGVKVGEFGNEGSGGQSYLRYPWETGKTYGFLTRVRPDGNGNTEYTTYFHVPSERKWMLIASLRRPETSTWYKGAYSFLENFVPDMGYVSRAAHYSNQWVWDKSGKAYELTDAEFTCDGTGRAGVRSDYAGGVSADGKAFVLKNCGFFNDMTPDRTPFERKSSGKTAPMINFSALEKL